MNEVVVVKRKFEEALIKIEESSKENMTLPELLRFQEKGGLFSLFNKNVTGTEMNNFASKVQENLIVLNTKTNRIFNQFTDVYNAFETLDKEYISGIVGAFNQAMEATKKAEEAQKEINETVELLSITVGKIKEFNDKVSFELSRLGAEDWRDKALKHKEQLEQLDNKATEIISTIDSYRDKHNELIEQLDGYKKEKNKNSKMIKFYEITTLICVILMAIMLTLVITGVI